LKILEADDITRIKMKFFPLSPPAGDLGGENYGTRNILNAGYGKRVRCSQVERKIP
jgi:hypothetical protein